jgi:1-acyl-sn-glycerol-3-phosphate acyltransferase
MIEDLLYICPKCLQPDAIRSEKTTTCTSCGAQLRRRGRDIVIDGDSRPSHVWYAAIREFPPPKTQPNEIGEKLYFASGRAGLSQARFVHHWRPSDFLYARLELPQRIGSGRFIVTEKNFLFRTEQTDFIFPLGDITCITTDSSHFIFRVKNQPFYRIDFDKESPLKFENWSRRVLVEYWLSIHGRKIVEFQPQIRFSDRVKNRVSRSFDLDNTVSPRDSLHVRISYFLLHRLFALVLGPLIGTRVIGREKMPATGPCIAVLNHEGYWDAYFAQVLLPRRIAFFAKNSEFKNPLFRYVLRVFRAIPVKRYQADASCIRNALAWLRRGQAVGIFIEGERSWDGRPLPPKRGVIRLLLATGVPVVPVRISGSFEMLPRWGRRMQRPGVRLVVGEAIELDREKWTVESAGERIMSALAQLGNL